ncbi:odorant receptor Or2-like isoform X1 [Linepithema humile]|uniref:odorant receptor Or2-like isoform X1 n=1 Tax=Linepithema humile TaxID=83485 RepID=UPI00351E705B
MNKVDHFIQNSQYNVIRILLSIAGLWPYHSAVRRYVTYVVTALILGSGFTFQIMGVIKVWENTLEVVDSLPLLLFAVANIFKLIALVIKLPKIKLLLIKIQEYCVSSKSDGEYKIQQSHATYGRNFGIVYISIILFHDILLVITTGMGGFTRARYANRTSNSGVFPGLPYRVDYMVDIDTNYMPIFIHTHTCHIGYMALIIICDTFYLTLVEYCCGLFDALRFRLEHVYDLKDKYNGLSMSSAKNKCYSNVAYSIRRHAEAIEFVAILESAYSVPLFIHVGCSVLIMSCIGYQILTYSGNLSHLLHHISYLNGLIINVFFENWQGQKIIDSSEKVFDSPYNAEWYSMPIETRKLLVIIIMKSEKPLTLSAANKLIVMSYVTFNAMMRMSMSYFTLLRSMQ